jgi:4-amino-4-deoxy-L-arabinose transferase-like glycosyltransferase
MIIDESRGRGQAAAHSRPPPGLVANHARGEQRDVALYSDGRARAMIPPRDPSPHGAPQPVAPARSDVAWLGGLVWRAFLLRATLAIVLHFSGMSLYFAPDEDTYAAEGQYLSAYWSGDVLLEPLQTTTRQAPGYFYLNAISFTLFGSVVPLKLLNALLGALACRLAYLLAHGIFNAAVARRTAMFVAYLPSLVLWSALNIRDVWLVFLMLLISWKSRQLVTAYKHRVLLTLVGAIVAVTFFRQYLFFAVTLPIVLSLLLGRRASFGRQFLLALLLGVVVVVLGAHGAAQEATKVMDLEALSRLRQGMTLGAASSIGQDVDISTPGKALAYLPIGLAYFFFSPFPWQITSPLKTLSIPEVLFIYWLTPSIIRGVRYTLRFRFRETMQTLLLAVFLTVSYALGSGNVGTLYRHRAQAIVFLLLFAAVGLDLRKRARSAVSEVKLTVRQQPGRLAGL